MISLNKTILPGHLAQSVEQEFTISFGGLLLLNMDTKRCGNIGEAVAISNFVKYGIPVYLPFGDNERADLIAEFGGKLNKIQVKTSVYASDGKMVFDLTSSTVHRKNGVRHKYNNKEIDYFFCYNVERDKSFLIKAPDKPISVFTIRYEASKNNQTKNINYEHEYLFENIVNSLI